MINKAATVASGVFSEDQDGYPTSFYFGVMIGQLYGRTDDSFGSREMRLELERFATRLPSPLIKRIDSALTLLEGGCDATEAIERMCGYYDEATGKPWREIRTENE